MNRISAGPVPAQRPAAALSAPAPVSNHQQVVAWYAAFAAFAAVVFAASGEPVQRAWGASAAAGYALAALTVALWRSRGRQAALVMALAGALAAPLSWVTFGGKMSRAGDDSLQVVARSAVLLLQHGTPYLPAGQISRALEYNPYEPAMAIFGLPAALGLHGAAGNPRLWLGITAAAVLAAAFRLAKRGSALRITAFAFGSPVLALPLTQGLTDLPVLALLSLTLACISTDTRRRVWLAGAIALGAACAMKATAWPALPVIVAMLAARDGARAATKFAVTAGLTTTALVAATAPASVTAPAALFLNTVLFPLGMTRYQTDADSPLPGHLLAAATGSAGHWAAIGLLCAASLAVVVSLVVRPPADTGAVARRLAVSLAILFALAPATRWGYFVYPAALLGFVSMTRSERGPWGAILPQRAAALRHLRRWCRVARRGRRLAGVGEQLERLRVEPVPGRGIDLTPQRVESGLPACRDVPGVVSAVIPRQDATGTVAVAVGLATKLDPKVGID